MIHSVHIPQTTNVTADNVITFDDWRHINRYARPTNMVDLTWRNVRRRYLYIWWDGG